MRLKGVRTERDVGEEQRLLLVAWSRSYFGCSSRVGAAGGAWRMERGANESSDAGDSKTSNSWLNCL